MSPQKGLSSKKSGQEAPVDHLAKEDAHSAGERGITELDGFSFQTKAE